MTVCVITFGDVEEAALTADVDEALAKLQNKAGITDGGVASVVFSGFDWETMPIVARISRIFQWITLERTYEAEHYDS